MCPLYNDQFETTDHLMLHCPNLDDLRQDLLPPTPDITNILYSTTDQHKNTSRAVDQRGHFATQQRYTPHTRVTQGWLEKYGWEILPHPPNSPDLTSSDYQLFGPLKRELAGKRVEDDEELVDHMRKWLQNLDGSFFREGIYSMVRRWQKCVEDLAVT
ncbi:histone-lysine N-methyltransferase SETMAR [Elysia marginata]|uniref:Histone-lysine N-methyltransferase SETMAR n=1 Tax=Elysia marginata TaxID=1093978 RepID=A0AAV4FC37_9GAST|nr:histone-lysine N-methyltransferase SETMAR [Elysia marginata]